MSTEALVRPGPLVAPGPALSDEQRIRASRQMLLPGLGDEGQRRLRAARVLVIGGGGLGSASIPYLVGSGVGTIGIVDDDAVELSNLHRQITHTVADLGRAKTDSLADAAARLDPDVLVRRHTVRLSAGNALDVLRDYDLVIDGSDNFATRYLVNDAAQLRGIPLVWGAILQHHGQVSVAWHAYGPGYRDLFPDPPTPGAVPSCSVGGVLPGLCGTIGSLLATEALKIITGMGEPLIGRVLVYDALAARFSEVPYARDPEGEPATELVDFEVWCEPEAGAVPTIGADALAERIRAGEPVSLLDVREAHEWADLRIRGAAWSPLSALADSIVDAAAFVVAAPARTTIVCAHGVRAVRAAEMLIAAGAERVDVLAGGLTEFAAVANELVETTRAGELA